MIRVRIILPIAWILAMFGCATYGTVAGKDATIMYIQGEYGWEKSMPVSPSLINRSFKYQ